MTVTRSTNCRTLLGTATVVFLTVGQAAALLSPAQQIYRVGIDVGNDPAEGCDLLLDSAGPPPLIPGIDLLIEVEVDADQMPPQVVSAQLRKCNQATNTFENPTPLSGFSVDPNTGLMGADGLVGCVPQPFLDGSLVQPLRLVFHSISSDDATDTLITTDGSPDGDLIVVFLVSPAPAPALGSCGLIVVLLLLLAVASVQWQRGRWATASTLLVALAAGVVASAYASFGDPIAIDDPSDANPPDPRAEILAAFATVTDEALCVRLEIEDMNAACGDGILHIGEACDDGNAIAGDGCAADCTVEPGFACPPPGTACNAICGDGMLVGGEACDDGNTNDTDACTSTCQNAVCGDGFVRIGVEECDDGNTNDTDACKSTCQNAVCGDGFVRIGVEECDDGNAIDTDACKSTCQNAVCGDGFVRIGVEECDDGNAIAGDGCAVDCTVEPGFACPPPGTACNAICGDGMLLGGEACDDGNANSGDGCSSTCSVE